MSFTDYTVAQAPDANSSFDGRQVTAAVPRAFDVDRSTQLTRRGNAGSTARNLITQLTCGKLWVNFSTFYLLAYPSPPTSQLRCTSPPRSRKPAVERRSRENVVPSSMPSLQKQR
jgi:hypothetical protein